MKRAQNKNIRFETDAALGCIRDRLVDADTALRSAMRTAGLASWYAEQAGGGKCHRADLLMRGADRLLSGLGGLFKEVYNEEIEAAGHGSAGGAD